jgi:hypothetical protein
MLYIEQNTGGYMFGKKLELEEGEVILCKKTASAKWEGLVSTDGKVDGKLTVTNKRLIFKVSAFIDADFGGVELRMEDIDHVTKEKYMLVFPQVSVVLKSGEKYSFPLLSGGNELKNIIEQQINGV